MKDFFKHNGGLILVIAILLTAIVAVCSLLLGGVANPISNVLGIIATPFRNGANAVVNWTAELYSGAFENDLIREENERLRQQVADLEEKAKAGDAASRENERLRNLLGLREKRRDLVFESAAVTAHSASNWESSFTIGKGSALGIAAQDCVVDEYGNLVGVVSEVGENWATVLTVVDSAIDMGALLERTDDAAILEGDFSLMTQGRAKLSYLPENSQLMAGDSVLTSGKGGVYPSGLSVGTVEEVHIDAGGMSRYAVVAPKADLERLRQVFVITDFDIVE